MEEPVEPSGPLSRRDLFSGLSFLGLGAALQPLLAAAASAQPVPGGLPLGGKLPRRAQAVMRSVMPLLPFLEQYDRVRNDPEIIDLSLGNPHDMPVAGFVEALARRVPPKDPSWYAYKTNEPGPRAVAAAALSRWRGVAYEPDDIFLTNGATAGLATAVQTVTEPGDEVIYIRPPWPVYAPLIAAAGAEPIGVWSQLPSFDLDLKAISGAITPRTRALIVNSPHNPSGRIYPPATLERLARLLSEASVGRERPIYLVSDEAYSRICFTEDCYPSPTTFYPHSFLVYTFTKTLLTPGQRLGYLALPPEMPERTALRAAVNLFQIALGWAFPSALLQHALADLEKLSIDVGRLRRRRDFVVRSLREQGYELHVPDGTFYVMVRSPAEDDRAFCQELLKRGVFVFPGYAIEHPGYFRITLTATDEMLKRSLKAFQAAIRSAEEVRTWQ